jgi:hypothetical protein
VKILSCKRVKVLGFNFYYRMLKGVRRWRPEGAGRSLETVRNGVSNLSTASLECFFKKSILK